MAKTGGFIKIWRGVRESDLWDPAEERFDRRSAFFDILLRANHKRRTIRRGLQHVTVKPGEFVTSQRKLAEAWGWDVAKVNRFLHVLAGEGRIRVKTKRQSGQGYTMISVLNWELYQVRDYIEETPSETPSETPMKRQRNANETPMAIKQEAIEGEEAEERSSPPLDIDPLEEKEKENEDDLELWMSRSTFSSRDDLQQRRIEAENCLLLYNDLTGSSVALTPKLFRQYVALWDLWDSPEKIRAAVMGLFCEPEKWALNRNLGPGYAWKDPEIAERYVAFARDNWDSGGWEKVLSMKRARRPRSSTLTGKELQEFRRKYPHPNDEDQE